MRPFFLICALFALVAAPLTAQISLPRVDVPSVDDGLRQVDETLEDSARATERRVEKLARERLRMIDRLVGRNRDVIERDASGAPARRGELLVLDASTDELAAVGKKGFGVLSREKIESLDLALVRLSVPEGMSLADAERELRRLMPAAEISADNLYLRSGRTSAAVHNLAASSSRSGSAPVGMIDGAPGSAVRVAEVRGFARGAPYPSNHGSAVASLLAYAGAGPIRVADVYGTDKAGGNALAIAKGLGWLVSSGSKVVTISLVGPRNAVLGRAIAAAQRKNVVVIAAVGNDGPASPPSYPASYDGVIAVTAVDGKRRALIEAGRALHLDYAAPGADIYGRNAKGRRIELRGTSFATPLVAARASQAIGNGEDWRGALDDEAIDLGRDGHDDIYGRGLVCASCTGR